MMQDIISQLKQSRIVHLCIGISFFTSGLIINFTQFLLHIFLKPFNKRLYRAINYYLCYSLYSQLVFITDWWSNSKLYVYIDEDILKKYVGKEHIILMMNHSYEIDWLIGWVFCEKSGVLGNCKAYAKKVIQYIPVIGWAWKFAEFVFLERSYDKDREIIQKQIKEIFEYPHPVWLLLNAEGTRFTPQKHEASIKFARERGMVELKHHLIPRTKGFTASLPSLRGRCQAIYDINISFKKDDIVAPTMSNLLYGHGVTGYMYVRRLPVDDIPENEDDAAEWLQNVFREKDRIQDSFHTHGNYFTSSGFPEVKCYLQQRRLPTLLNLVCWAIVTLIPLSYYMIMSLFSGSLVGFSIVAGIIILFYVLMQKSIGMSTLSTASSYGSEVPNTKQK